MNNELVSAVVAIYNGEKYLEECVMSILNQTYQNLEVLLVDDGSTDNSRAICKRLEKVDKRVITIFREKNGGVSECRLTGLNAATGDWLIYVDHDDTIPSDCVETFLEVADSNMGVEIVCGSVSEHYVRDSSKDKIVSLYSGDEIIKRYFDDPMIKTSHESKLYKRKLLLSIDVSEYRTRCPICFFDDILITPIILGTAKQVAILSGVYYLHREVQTSISRSNRLNSFMYDHVEAGDIMLQYFHANKCDRSYGIKLARYYQDILRIFCLMDFNDIDASKKQYYEEKIIAFYKKYKKEFKKYAITNRGKRIFFLMFGISPTIWKFLVQKTYYRSYVRS